MATALPSIIMGAGAASSVMSVMGANSQAKDIKRQGEYNAQVYEQQGAMLLEKRKIEEAQFLRQRRFAEGATVAHTAGAGFELGGSPMNILIDTMTQMEYDNAINDYNTQVESNYLKSAATASRYDASQKAKLAKTQGYTNAFSTMLNTSLLASNLKFGSNPLSIDQVRAGRTYSGGAA